MSRSQGELVFKRDFSISNDRLWHLLTDAKSRESWGAPSDDAVLVVDVHDVRVGGMDRHRCGPAESPEFMVETRWYLLEEADRACFTETVEAGGQRLFTSLVTYELEPNGSGSHLTATVQTSSFVGEEAMAEIEEGWTSGLNRLERIAASELAH